MGAVILNEAFAASIMKRGDPPRNLTGNGGAPRGSYERSRQLKAALQREGDEPCGVEGHEGKTKFDFLIWRLWNLAMAGDRWAGTTILQRLYGRVPTTVELQLAAKLEIDEGADTYRDVPTDELFARVQKMREEWLSSNSIDVTPLGSSLTGHGPNRPQPVDPAPNSPAASKRKEEAWLRAYAENPTRDFIEWEQSYAGPPSDWPRE